MNLTVDDIIRLVLVAVVVCLPALAITLAITARFAARPIVDAIARLRELSGPATPQIESRVASIEAELHRLRTGLDRLTTSVEFESQLRAGDAPPRLPQA